VKVWYELYYKTGRISERKFGPAENLYLNRTTQEEKHSYSY
jgi:hypothetical protein